MTTPGRNAPGLRADIQARINKRTDMILWHLDQAEAIAREIRNLQDQLTDDQPLAVIGQGDYAREVQA